MADDTGLSATQSSLELTGEAGVRVTALLDRLDALGAEDFHSEHGMGIVEDVCFKLEMNVEPEAWLERVFRFMERLDDVDLGSPGPVVHLIESSGTQYHHYLVESIQRKPTLLTVWMVNRAANISHTARGSWRGLLQEVASRKGVSKAAAAEAADFLEY